MVIAGIEIISNTNSFNMVSLWLLSCRPSSGKVCPNKNFHTDNLQVIFFKFIRPQQTDINNHLRNMVSELSESGKHVNGEFKAAGEELLKQSNIVLGGLESTISSVLSDTGENVTKQVRMLDDAMAKEIEQAMGQLGNALGRITGQFTSDYQNLVNEMKKVVSVQARL